MRTTELTAKKIMAEEEKTPTEELFMEVLAARTRLGEHYWTFSNRPAIVKASKSLEGKGLVFLMNGAVERSFRAGLTEKGKDDVIDDEYTPPIQHGYSRCAMTAEEIAAVAKTIELLERDAWSSDRHLAEALRSWMKGKL